MVRPAGIFLFVLLALGFTAAFQAMEPPTPEQLERYRQDGTLYQRILDAEEIGNQRVSPELVRRFAKRVNSPNELQIDGWPPFWMPVMPSTGNVKVFALLVAFEDYPFSNSTDEIHGWLFEDGDVEALTAGILHALRKRKHLPAMGHAARELAEARGDWKTNFQALFRAYEVALSKK